jgi:hypothetical protein
MVKLSRCLATKKTANNATKKELFVTANQLGQI